MGNACGGPRPVTDRKDTGGDAMPDEEMKEVSASSQKPAEEVNEIVITAKDLDDIREHVAEQSQKLENIIHTISKTEQDDGDAPKTKQNEDLLDQLPLLIDELGNRLNSLLEEKDELAKEVLSSRHAAEQKPVVEVVEEPLIENGPEKPHFYDMLHSNNAARIRIWIALKNLGDEIDTTMITYPILQSEDYKKINPLRKLGVDEMDWVPAFKTSYGTPLFESPVIHQYLEDKYFKIGPSFTPENPETRAKMNLFLRIHDLYIASPNCSQAGFAHTQGCMYLGPYESEFCPSFRVMERDRRAKKLAELFKHLKWLENQMDENGPYILGDQLTLPDMTWFPTIVFMEFMMPVVFEWPDIFDKGEHGFPKLSAWYTNLKTNDDPIFPLVHKQIWDFWVEKKDAGQFEPIIEDIEESLMDDDYIWKYEQFVDAYESNSGAGGVTLR